MFAASVSVTVVVDLLHAGGPSLLPHSFSCYIHRFMWSCVNVSLLQWDVGGLRLIRAWLLVTKKVNKKQVIMYVTHILFYKKWKRVASEGSVLPSERKPNVMPTPPGWRRRRSSQSSHCSFRTILLYLWLCFKSGGSLIRPPCLPYLLFGKRADDDLLWIAELINGSHVQPLPAGLSLISLQCLY